MESVTIDALGGSTEQMPVKPDVEPETRDSAAFDDAVNRFRAAMGEGLDLEGLDLSDGLDAEEPGVAIAPDDAADAPAVVNPMAYNPIADAPAVQQTVGDTMKVTAVESAESVRSVFLSTAVEELCEAIQVAPGVQPGQGEVRIQLKADVLAGTEVFLEAKGTTITVAFNPATADVAEVLARNITQFQQHLAGRIHNYQIAAKVNKGLKS